LPHDDVIDNPKMTMLRLMLLPLDGVP
jgi:hypothetical protein